MSQSSNQLPSQTGAAADLSSEAERIIGALSALRSQIVKAWQERGVMFTLEEQARLRDEIKATCTFLTDLIVSS